MPYTLQGGLCFDGAALGGATTYISADTSLASASLVISTATGQLTTQIPLSGAAQMRVSAQGDLDFTISFRSDSLAVAAAQAQLETSIPFLSASSMVAVVTGQLGGTLAVFPPAQIWFVQSVPSSVYLFVYQTGAQSMQLAVGPQGVPPGVTWNGGTRMLAFDGRNLGLPIGGTLNTPGHLLIVDDAVGFASASVINPMATSAMSNDTALSSAAAVRVGASAILTTSINFSSAALIQAYSSASLDIGSDLTSNAVATAQATGDLTTIIELMGAARVEVTSTGRLGQPQELASAGTVTISSTGQISTAISMQSSSLVSALSGGDLEVAIRFSSAAAIAAQSTSYLTTPEDTRLESAAVVEATMTGALQLGLHMRQQIRDAAGLAVTGLQLTQDRVFLSRSYPVQRADLPCLLVYTVSEESIVESMALPALQRRILTLAIECVAKADVAVDSVLDEIARQVEDAVMDTEQARVLKGLVPGALTLVGTEIEMRQGEVQMGVARLLYEATYWVFADHPETSAV